jgi:signal transduction histidine kinase
MREQLLKIKNFLGPYDYRPGFIYLTILVFSLSNLRTYTFDYEYGPERIRFFFTGLLAYAFMGLPLYLVLKASQVIWGKRRKSFRIYILEMALASLITVFVQIAGQRYLIPLLKTGNFLNAGIFVGEFITRFVFAIFFVAITHNRLRTLGENLATASALNSELNERYVTLVESDEEIRSHASQLLHDRIQAKLMLAGAKLTRVSEVISDEGKLGLLPVIKEIEHIRSIEVREVSQLLTPNIAGEGLIGSCETLLDEFSSDLTFTLEISQDAESFDEEFKLGIYRIIEQGVINSIKHGPASHVTIRAAESRANEICVEVIDNGPGGPGGSVNGSGKGTVIIDAWLSILGGRKEIESRAGHGFTLRVFLPKK